MRKIVKFEKENCSPCNSVSEFLEGMSITYEKINPFNDPEQAVKNKVRTVPTVILFEGDQEIDRIIGFKPDELREMVSKL